MDDLAKELDLSPRQEEVLLSELRNALVPALVSAQRVSVGLKSPEVVGTESPIVQGIERVLRLCQAIQDRGRAREEKEHGP